MVDLAGLTRSDAAGGFEDEFSGLAAEIRTLHQGGPDGPSARGPRLPTAPIRRGPVRPSRSARRRTVARLPGPGPADPGSPGPHPPDGE